MTRRQTSTPAAAGLPFAVVCIGLLGSLASAAPNPPANLTLTAPALSGQVGLAWNPSSGATSYNLKRATAADGAFSTLGSPTTNSFTDTTAVAGMRFFYQVTAVNATGESTASLTISTTPSIVVDNGDASGVTISGSWTASTGLPGFHGSDYLHDNNTGGTGGKSLRFTPTLPFSGRYDVYLRWVSNTNRASNARVEILSNAGTTFTRVNQKNNGGTWVKLGAFNFNSGAGGHIRIRNDGADGFVIADAVQMVLNEQPLPGYTRTTFADEFDGTGYDPAVWSVHDNRPNNFVSGGQLRLTTTANGGEWETGSLYTSRFIQRFGYFEAVFQIGSSDGLNNAFWLNTPASHFNNADRLEVDISEAHAHEENHVGVHDWAPVHDHTGTSHAVPDIHPGYHVVGLEWATDGTMRWYWDGQLVHTLAASELNACRSMLPLQVMLSTKVISFAGTPGPTMDGSSMNVDNVRVWMKPGWGGAVTGNWGSGPNWGPDGVPDAGDAAVFNRATSNTTVSLASDKSVKELYFTTPECPPMTLAAGSYKLLLGALASGTGVGGIVVNADVTTPQTIETAIQAQNNLTFANYSNSPDAALNLNSVLTSSATGRALSFGGNGRVNVGSSIGSSFGDLLKVNTGTTVLSGANAFTGTMAIENGELVVNHASALGATTAGTTVASGASLALANGVNIAIPETVSLAGNGETGTAGALDVADDSSVAFNGVLAMTAAAWIGSGLGSGTLTLGSNLNTTASAFGLTFNGTGRIIMNGSISGAGAVTKTGSGTVILSGANTYSGATNVSGGTLALGADNALPDTSAVTIGNATLDAASFGDTAGMLDVSAAATINLGAGSSLVFADSQGVDWTGGTLTITGTFVPGSSIKFATSGGLSATQLGRITATGFSSFALDANGFLTATVAGGYAAWQTANSTLGSIDEDHDNDGVDNGVEYFMFGNTSSTGFTTLPGASGNTVIWTKAASGYLGEYNTHFFVEVSDTLASGSWTVAPQGAGPGQVLISGNNVTYAFPTGAKKFARLKVTGP